MAHLSLVSTFRLHQVFGFFAAGRNCDFIFFLGEAKRRGGRAKISDMLGHLLMGFNVLVSPPQNERTTS